VRARDAKIDDFDERLLALTLGNNASASFAIAP
jgi:hypothetical protein